jgi:hypothetical protein
MANYLALSTTNYSQNGYTVYAESTDKQDARSKAEKVIVDSEAGIYRETLLKNLTVVSKTDAKRKYGITD